MKKNEEADAEKLLYTENFHSDATKYGIGTEPQAKTRYMAVAKRFHKGLKSNDFGLAILKDYSFIAASPDHTFITLKFKGRWELQEKSIATFLSTHLMVTT